MCQSEKTPKQKNPHDSVPLRRNSVQEEYYSIGLTTVGVYSGGGEGTLDFKRWGGANGDKLKPKKSLRLEAKPPKKSFAPPHHLKSGVPPPPGGSGWGAYPC